MKTTAAKATAVKETSMETTAVEVNAAAGTDVETIDVEAIAAGATVCKQLKVAHVPMNPQTVGAPACGSNCL